MNAFNVIHLGDREAVDLGAHLSGRWGHVQVLDLEAGGSRSFDASSAEVCAFVVRGHGTVAMGDDFLEVEAGTGITLVKGASAVVRSTSPMRLFAASLPA